MIRLFLDANVLFTAAYNPNGKAALVVAQALAGHWEVVTSAYAAEEARRNMRRKFPRHLGRFESMLTEIRVIASPRGDGCPLPLRDKDRPIFAAALACEATHLLIGDLRDFGSFMNDPERTAGIPIQPVAEFLKSIG